MLKWILCITNLYTIMIFLDTSFCLQVFVAIALILGDGLYNLIKIIAITIKELCNINTKQNNLPVVKEILGEYYKI